MVAWGAPAGVASGIGAGLVVARTHGLRAGVLSSGAGAIAGALALGGGALLLGESDATATAEPIADAATPAATASVARDARQLEDILARDEVGVDDYATAALQLYDGDDDGSVQVGDELRRTTTNGDQASMYEFFSRADANGDGDGSVTLSEARAVVAAMDTATERDGDALVGDGFLGRAERRVFGEVFREHAVGVSIGPRTRIGALTDYVDPMSMGYMQRYDLDYDGEVDVEQEARVGTFDSSALFEAADTTGDGVVTLDELDSHLLEFDASSEIALGFTHGGVDARIDPKAIDAAELLEAG